MQPQAGQDAQVHNTSATPSTIPTDNTNPMPRSNKSNEIPAAYFLQRTNGNFVVRKTSFQLSPRVADRMSVQSYSQRS
eukprot:9401136-Ditylum_brightwellii.AAC.1